MNHTPSNSGVVRPRFSPSALKRSLSTLLHIVLLCGSLLSLAYAATPYKPTYADPVTESWRWSTFSELQGAGLRCAASDGQGAMWFGTDTGVQRYDGMAWQVFTVYDGLPRGRINAICTSATGEVFAGSDHGISRFSNSVWVPVLEGQDKFPWYVNDLEAATDGSVWAATEWGALRLHGSRAKLYTTEDRAKAVRTTGHTMEIEIIPGEVSPVRRWSDGIGVGVVVSNGLIWSVAQGGPCGEGASESGRSNP